MAEDERYYPRKAEIAGKLAIAVEAAFLAKGYQTQMLPMENNSLVVQIRKVDALKTLTGTAESISVSLQVFDEDLKVRVGEGKWIDKVGVGVAGWFLLWPLLFTAGYGLFRQSQLVSEVWAFVEGYIHQGHAAGYRPTAPAPESYGAPPPPAPAYEAPPPPPPRPPATAYEAPPPPRPPAAPPPRKGKQCPGCKALVRAKAAFCPHCGAAFAQRCPACGEAIEPAMRFCPSCGAKRP